MERHSQTRSNIQAVFVTHLACAVRLSPARIPLARVCSGLFGLGIMVALSVAAWAVEPIEQLERAIPRRADTWNVACVRTVAEAAFALDEWAAGQAWPPSAAAAPPPADAEVVARLVRLVEAVARVDRCVESVEELRGSICGQPLPRDALDRAGQYLALLATLNKVQGRLRYMLHEAIENATYSLDASQPPFTQLLETLLRHRSRTGAEAMAYMLFDPDPSGQLKPFPPARKIECLRLLSACGATETLHDLGQFLTEPNVSSELMIEAISAIRQIGLPQDPWRGASLDEPIPPVYAAQLREILSRLVIPAETPVLKRQRDDLLSWATQRAQHGVTGETFRWGSSQLRGGDWILVSRTSPLGSVTNLSPGIFSQAGVVTEDTGGDRKRRFLVVALPEQAEQVEATNVDLFLTRASYYLILRHTDPEVTRRMNAAARELIGNESQFDPLLNAERIAPRSGQPLQGQLVHASSGGLLLLCGQAAGRPWEEFFPIGEQPAGGQWVANLQQLGIAVGPRIVSPTGALFGSQMQIVGRGEPRYEPADEIAQAICDHCVHRLGDERLIVSPKLKQSLARHLVQVSHSTPWLSRALTRARDESAHRDLESTARAAALWDLIEATARRNALTCLSAVTALQPPPDDDAADAVRLPSDSPLLSRHQTLFATWRAGKLNPWQLRSELVEYYIQAGCQQLDQLFFPTVPSDR